MVLRSLSAVLVATLALAGASHAATDGYRPDEFLTLDLSRALLSPKRLGPPTEFARVPVEAKGDRTSEAAARSPIAEAPRRIATRKVRAESRPKLARATGGKSQDLPRARLAHHRGNPLDAQARDTRIQVWPCRAGGSICNWK